MRCHCCNTYIGRKRSKVYSTSKRDYLEYHLEEGEDYGGEIDGEYYCVDCYEDVLKAYEEDEEDGEEE
jgi:hypothetical protein